VAANEQSKYVGAKNNGGHGIKIFCLFEPFLAIVSADGNQ
jgi:hypothetical protein